MQHDHNAPPLNPLPPVVWLISLPILAVEILLSAAGAGFLGQAGQSWRLGAVQDHGFYVSVFRDALAKGLYTDPSMVRLVTYPFIHLSFTHMLMVFVFVLALGKMVGEVFRPWAVVAVFLGSAVAGALAYAALTESPFPLAGGYPAAYGLIGAFTYLLWTRLSMANSNRYRAFTLIGFLLGAQLLFGLLFGGNSQWIAEVAGFGAGFALSFLVAPGGWRRVVGQLRQR